MKFKTLLKIYCVLAFEFDFNVGNKKKLLSKKTLPTNLIQTALVLFGFYFKSQLNETKPHTYLSRGLDEF